MLLISLGLQCLAEYPEHGWFKDKEVVITGRDAQSAPLKKEDTVEDDQTTSIVRRAWQEMGYGKRASR